MMFTLTVIGIWVSIKSCQIADATWEAARNDKKQDSVLSQIGQIVIKHEHELEKLDSLLALQQVQLHLMRIDLLQSTNTANAVNSQLNLNLAEHFDSQKESILMLEVDKRRLYAILEDIRPIIVLKGALIDHLIYGDDSIAGEANEGLRNHIYQITGIMQKGFGNTYLRERKELKKLYEKLFDTLIKIATSQMYDASKEANKVNYWRYYYVSDLLKVMMNSIETSDQSLFTTFQKLVDERYEAKY